MLNFGYGKDYGKYAKESGDFAQQAAEDAINAVQDVENAKNGALNATESANTAASNADEAAGNADNKVAELATYDERVEDIETELVDVRQSIVKSKTFPKLDDRLEEQEADTYVPMKNEIVNGDFSQGLTGWILMYNQDLGTVVEGKYSFSGVPIGNGRRGQDILANTSDKLYISLQTNVISGELLRLEHSDYNTVASNNSVISYGMNSGLFSVIVNAKTNGSRVAVTYAAEKSYNSIIDNLLVINLTKTFGKGNEPTKEEMDRLLAKYPNSFFNGTVNLTPKLLDDLRYLTSDVQVPMRNLSGNTDAGMGYNAWISGSGITDLTYNPSEKTLEFTGSGSVSGSSANWVYYRTAVVPHTPNQIYYSATTAKRVSGSGKAYVSVGYSNSSYELTESFSRISYRGTISVTTGRENFTMGADAGVKIAFKDPVLLSLTEIFGAGNEPTQAQMDALLATYPNSWFDGTVNLAENKRIIPFLLKRLELKADKAQEAWITPTYTNGATGSLQLRKNQFGAVEFKGALTVSTANTTQIALPTGYRPNRLIRKDMSFNDGTGVVSVAFTTSAIYIFATPNNPVGKTIDFDFVQFTT